MVNTFIDPGLLADNCHSHHMEDVVRNFTPEELIEFKSELADCHVQLQQRNSLVQKVKSLLKEDLPNPIETVLQSAKSHKIEGESGTKQLSGRISYLSEAINKKSIENHETVYVFYYHEDGRAGVYNVNGYLIYERPLRPDEKQIPLFNIKTGTNE